MRGTPTSGPWRSIEMVETRVIESPGCSIWTRLSASMSNVIATATVAPLSQGAGRLSMEETCQLDDDGGIVDGSLDAMRAGA